MAARCPYVVGNEIPVWLVTSSGQQKNENQNHSGFRTIRPLVRNGSCSTGLSSAGTDGGPYGAEALREDERVSPWNPDIEREYHSFIQSGSASEFLAKLHSNPKMAEEEGDEWDGAQNETYFHSFMKSLYESEVEVYHTLEDMQGKDIP